MEAYKDISYSNEDELYDYKEIVGDSSWERMKFLTNWLKAENKKEMEELLKLHQWEE